MFVFLQPALSRTTFSSCSSRCLKLLKPFQLSVPFFLVLVEANDMDKTFVPVNIFVSTTKVDARINNVNREIEWRIQSMSPKGVDFKIEDPVSLLLNHFTKCR